MNSEESNSETSQVIPTDDKETSDPDQSAPPEYGGRDDGTDPTRYGDWEKNGRCIDF